MKLCRLFLVLVGMAAFAQQAIPTRIVGSIQELKGREFQVGGVTLRADGQTKVQGRDWNTLRAGDEVSVRWRLERFGGPVARTIFAEVDVELSQIDSAVRVGDYPGFIKRQTSTAFNAMEGESLAIAGLLMRERGKDRSAVPGLGALPLAGTLFRSKRQLRRETELLVLISPRRIEARPTALQPERGQRELSERADELRSGAMSDE